ncbi:MAG: hypothetical protein MZW92_79910 [Comamonadaceae bacterium]|nr:hypothetical protein [Comamonadaceae bacterium]
MLVEPAGSQLGAQRDRHQLGCATPATTRRRHRPAATLTPAATTAARPPGRRRSCRSVRHRRRPCDGDAQERQLPRVLLRVHRLPARLRGRASTSAPARTACRWQAPVRAGPQVLNAGNPQFNGDRGGCLPLRHQPAACASRSRRSSPTWWCELAGGLDPALPVPRPCPQAIDVAGSGHAGGQLPQRADRAAHLRSRQDRSRRQARHAGRRPAPATSPSRCSRRTDRADPALMNVQPTAQASGASTATPLPAADQRRRRGCRRSLHARCCAPTPATASA